MVIGKIFRTNVYSVFWGCKASQKYLQKTNGSIINISSIAGKRGSKNNSGYVSTKFAINGITQSLSKELGNKKVRVNAICPGHIVTEKMDVRWKEIPSGLKFFEEQYPVRRTGVPEDIANGVAFLCSDEASFITGHSLVIDGGLSIQLQEDFGVDQAKYALNNEIDFPY